MASSACLGMRAEAETPRARAIIVPAAALLQGAVAGADAAQVLSAGLNQTRRFADECTGSGAADRGRRARSQRIEAAPSDSRKRARHSRYDRRAAPADVVFEQLPRIGGPSRPAPRGRRRDRALWSWRRSVAIDRGESWPAA